MVTVVVPNVSTKVATEQATLTNLQAVSAKKLLGGEHSIFTLLDDDILNLIYATHVHNPDNKFDVESMFVIVESIIKRSNYLVDNIVQGAHVHAETIDDKNPKQGFTAPFCTLKSISSELSCKPPGEQIAHKAALEILHKVSNFSWDAKSVLSLAAFSMYYGDFWHFADGYAHPDQLVKSLAVIRRVPVLLNPVQLKRHQQAIVELSDLVKAVLQVVEILIELNKLTVYDQKDVPALAGSLEHFPVYVYWIIVTAVACSTKIKIFTSEEDVTHVLAPYAQKIHYILNKIKTQLLICRTQIEEAEYYRKLTAIFHTPTEVKEIIKALIFYKETNVEIFDGSTKQTVTLDVVKNKNVFLLISSLDITDEYINLLLPVYEHTKKNDQYCILWVPIVDKWTNELKTKFETVRSKLPWYVVQVFSPIWGVKYITKEWKYKGKPILVVLNHRGKVENMNAFHIIRVWGIDAFPFNKEFDDYIKGQSWISPIISNIDTTVATWIKEERYIFFYGGTDTQWIQNFAKKVATLVSDAVIKDLKISIEVYLIGKTVKGGEDLSILDRFWTGIESLFLTKIPTKVDLITIEIQKLLSYKNEPSWVLLTRGQTVVFASHGPSVVKIIDEFPSWKDSVKENGFEISVLEYLSKISPTFHFCSHLEIANTAGKPPKVLKCPECPRIMETYTAYKCCHVDNVTKIG